MIFGQIITVFIFYERHWDTVTRHMAQNLAGEIALLVSDVGSHPDPLIIDKIVANGWQYFSFPIQFQKDTVLTTPQIVATATYAENMLRRELKRQVKQPWRLDTTSDPNLIFVDLQMDNGVLRIYASRKRIFSSTSWTFIGWTVGSSIILFAMALLFLRGQVRPIHRLANAARQLGLGRTAPDYRERSSSGWTGFSGDAVPDHEAVERAHRNAGWG
jgi:two-component system osmolarity sensor histidine kinase EnvZ